MKLSCVWEPGLLLQGSCRHGNALCGVGGDHSALGDCWAMLKLIKKMAG